MNKSFLSLLISAALVACAPGPDGAPGAAGVKGDQGDQGSQGATGDAGVDAPTREGSIVWVSGGTVVAGSSSQMHVLAQYMEWTEAPVITTDHEGLTVEAVITSPSSMMIKLTARADIRGGEANLMMGGLPLPKTVEVIPAATFILDDEQSRLVRPGQSFSGRIQLAPGFGLNGIITLKTNENDEAPEGVVLTPIRDAQGDLRPFLFDNGGRPELGWTGIILAAVVSPDSPSGPMNWRVQTMDGQQTIPVYNAIEVADSPATELALGGSVDASLENGFGLYRLTRGENALISAGTVLRIELQDADFAANMGLSLPASDDDQAIVWSNTDANLSAHANAIEVLTPRTGVYFLTVDHPDNEVGAEFTFTASVEQVQIEPASGQDQEVTLARPGHGAWFARSVAGGQTLFWTIAASEGSDASPVSYIYRNYADDDGNDIYGDRLVFNNSPVIRGSLLNLPDGITWPDSLGEATFIWRVVDAQLGGGGGYGITFNGGVR